MAIPYSCTYDESINRLLNVFERVNSKQPFATRFIIDHAETVSERNIERIGAWVVVSPFSTVWHIKVRFS